MQAISEIPDGARCITSAPHRELQWGRSSHASCKGPTKQRVGGNQLECKHTSQISANKCMVKDLKPSVFILQ